MSEIFHAYTIEEINNINKSSISHNWGVTNFLAFVYAHDTNDGSSNIAILAFENKLNALVYFRDFLMSIKESCSGKNFFLKLSDIDNQINLINLNKSDEDINFDVVNFDIEGISLNITKSGYWDDVSKLILEQIIDEIDCYFDFRYEDELENDTSISLKEIQEQCYDLIKYTDIRNQAYIDKFIKVCHFMNNFWDEW